MPTIKIDAAEHAAILQELEALRESAKRPGTVYSNGINGQYLIPLASIAYLTTVPSATGGVTVKAVLVGTGDRVDLTSLETKDQAEAAMLEMSASWYGPEYRVDQSEIKRQFPARVMPPSAPEPAPQAVHPDRLPPGYQPGTVPTWPAEVLANA